ncbi:MAG: hypothetical protein KDB04_03970 [Acidimicrobiales bacterium]|nr:hypothetical protein [Acidimicrobiales bacterium]HRW39726.1 hypothetical protein [Aquihabitans sp.]
MRERLLAVVGAACLVALALVVRGAIVGGDDEGGSGGGRSDDGRPTVACEPELADVCDQLARAGAIGADPPTLELGDAAAPPDDVDAWITWDPAPAIADFDAGGDGVWGETTLLASGPLALLGTAGDLAIACGREPAWSCLQAATDAGQAIGVGDPSTAEGLARLLPIARTYATDDDPDTLDAAGLRDLVESPVGAQRDARQGATSLATAPGRLNLVVGPREVLASEAASAQGQNRGLVVASPGPSARASIVVAGRRAGDTDAVADAVCGRPGGAATEVEASLREVGASTRCEGDRVSEQLAGFLYQVREKVS